MDRNNSRYPFIRRSGQQQQQQSQQQPHQSSPSLSSSSSSSLSSTSNFERNSSTTSSAYSSASSSSANSTSLSHEELIRFIREAWTKVSEQTPVMKCNESDQQLKNFKPFNLEEFWGQRLIQNIQITQGNQ